MLTTAPVTISSFLIAIVLMSWSSAYAWRHRSGSAQSWALLQAAGFLMYAFVWVHFYQYGLGNLEAAGRLTPSFVDNVAALLETDIVATYFELFGRPEMTTSHISFWLFDVRDVTIVAFIWMYQEIRRRGGGWLACLAWAHTGFLATIAGCVSLFSATQRTELDPELPRLQPTTAFMVALGALLVMATINTVLGLSDARMGIQITLMFALALMPTSAHSPWKAETVYAALVGFAVLTRLIGLGAVFWNFGSEAPAMLYQAALYDPVIYGTISGEVFNVTLLGLFIALATRNWRLALAAPLVSATAGAAAGMAALLWWRERAAAA